MSYADAKAMATTAIPVIDMASLHEGTIGGARHVAKPSASSMCAITALRGT